ncbi:MAG TPA: FHA domain-containing protein [Kofleriaceae bacterium]
MSTPPIGFRVFRNNVQIDAIRLDRSVIKVGKVPSAHIKLDDPSVSRMHAIIEVDDEPSIIDLGSRTGTHVNGVTVNKAVLRAGDQIRIGVFTLVVDLEPLAIIPDHSQPISLDRLSDGLPAPPSATVQVPAVARRDPAKARQLAAWLRCLNDESRAFAKVGDQDEVEELMETLLIVAADKLREQRDNPEFRELYDNAIECLGGFRTTCAAPSLLLELATGLPKFSEQLPWRVNVCMAIATHDASWPYLERVAELPGYSTLAATAAVKAGRDPKPWLAHPYWRVRHAAARAISDDRMRTSALASVWESFARSEVPVDLDPRAGHRLSVPRWTRGRGDAWRTFDWRGEAKAEGIEIDTLPELPALVAGLQSSCADFRMWTIEAIDRRREMADLVELGIADELDAARARGGWPRTEVDWESWRRVVPELPLEASARRNWLFAYGCAQGDLAGGAIALLSGAPPTFEPPHLVLDADVREAILDNERCELLAALIRVEEAGTRLESKKEAMKTPALPDS